MSLGERIASIRKEKGLSQEEFGNELNVTRQSVSKWESDQAFPEVDKLISISKRYNVSVEWLIGNQDNRNSPDDLSEKHLQTVESIFDKYLDNKSKSQYKKYVKGIFVGFVLFVLVSYGFHLINLIERLEANQKYLIRELEEVENRLDNEINNAEARLEEFIDYQNNPFLSSVVELEGYDYKTNTANLHVEVIPKEYEKSLEIQLIIDNTKSKKIIDLNKEDKIFSNDILIDVEDNITVSAIYKTNDTEKTVILKQYENILENTKYSSYGSSYSYDSGDSIFYYDIYFNLKSNEIMQCEIQNIDTYVFVEDNFVKKIRNNISKSDYIENGYYLEMNQNIIDMIKEEYKNESDFVTIKYFHVITDEFGRSYLGYQSNFEYNHKLDDMFDNYDENDIDKDFNWEDYE